MRQATGDRLAWCWQALLGPARTRRRPGVLRIPIPCHMYVLHAVCILTRGLLGASIFSLRLLLHDSCTIDVADLLVLRSCWHRTVCRGSVWPEGVAERLVVTRTNHHDGAVGRKPFKLKQSMANTHIQSRTRPTAHLAWTNHATLCRRNINPTKEKTCAAACSRGGPKTSSAPLARGTRANMG